jgi:hypothetical protein
MSHTASSTVTSLVNPLVVNPLVSPHSLAWWAADGINLHGKIVTVVFDADGTHYNVGAGLKVMVNGAATAATSPPLPPLMVQLRMMCVLIEQTKHVGVNANLRFHCPVDLLGQARCCQIHAHRTQTLLHKIRRTEATAVLLYRTGIGLALFCRSDKSGMSIFLLLSWLGEWWHDNRQIHSAAVAHPN